MEVRPHDQAGGRGDELHVLRREVALEAQRTLGKGEAGEEGKATGISLRPGEAHELGVGHGGRLAHRRGVRPRHQGHRIHLARPQGPHGVQSGERHQRRRVRPDAVRAQEEIDEGARAAALRPHRDAATAQGRDVGAARGAAAKHPERLEVEAAEGDEVGGGRPRAHAALDEGDTDAARGVREQPEVLQGALRGPQLHRDAFPRQLGLIAQAELMVRPIWASGGEHDPARRRRLHE